MKDFGNVIQKNIDLWNNERFVLGKCDYEIDFKFNSQ